MANVTSDDLWKYLNNCNFDVDAKLYGDLLCVICMKIMQNAYQGPCGCKYCHKCIDSYLHDGDKLCPGKFADCKIQMLNMKGNLQVDHFANKKISLIPLKCAAEYCQYRNTKLNMAKHIASHQLRPNADRSDIGGDREQSPMFAIKDPLEYGIDCRMAMLAETIHNWRTEIGFMKDWADENRVQINKLERENENLKIEIRFLEVEYRKAQLRQSQFAVDPIGRQLAQGLDSHANMLTSIISKWRTEIGFIKDWDRDYQSKINKLEIENQGLRAEIGLLRAGDHEKKRIEKNENFETEIMKIEKLRKRIRLLKLENKRERAEINMLREIQIQKDERNEKVIVRKTFKKTIKTQLLSEDIGIERQNLKKIVEENAKFCEKIKNIQQDQNEEQMVVEEMMMGNEALKVEMTKYEKLYDRLRYLNAKNKNKQYKANKLRSDISDKTSLQMDEELALTKGSSPMRHGICTIRTGMNERLSKGRRKNIRIENRKKRRQTSKLKPDRIMDLIEMENFLEEKNQITFEREQLFQWYIELSTKEDNADLEAEITKNVKFREILKQLNMEKSKLKKFMRNFVTPDAVNTSDKVDSSEEEQLLADKASLANANLQVIAEKNKILLEKVHNLEADNKEKREEINKLRCILIVQQYKSRANVGGQGKRSDCEWEDDGVIAPNDSSDQSDWLKNGHPIGNCVPFEWKIESLSKKIEDAKSDIVTEIFSEPFYSHENGYKLQLRLHPGGSGPGAGTHLSVFVGLLPGEYDDALPWPMTRPVAVALLNQKSKTFHVVHEYHHQFQLVDNDRPGAEFVGCPHFMSSVDVLSNKNLRKKDAIVLICFLV